jgi:hypothetical protein
MGRPARPAASAFLKMLDVFAEFETNPQRGNVGHRHHVFLFVLRAGTEHGLSNSISSTRKITMRRGVSSSGCSVLPMGRRFA